MTDGSPPATVPAATRTPLRVRHGVVADDLTGAADAGVQLAAAGLATRVLLADDDLAVAVCGAEVLVRSTDGRVLPEGEAARRVVDALGQLRAAGVDQVFKKVDSTGRGHLTAEIEAALGVLGDDVLALVCPAFPARGRTVADGVLLVDGRPARDGDGVADPAVPWAGADLVDRLDRLAPGRLGREVLADGPAATAAALVAAHEAGRRVVVCDAADDGDLDVLAAAAGRLAVPVLPVGSAGLARAVGAVWATAGRAPTGGGVPAPTAVVTSVPAAAIAPAPAAVAMPDEQLAVRSPAAGGPDAPGTTLVVVGSRHAATRGQLDQLLATTGWTALRPDARTIAGPQLAWEAELAAARAHAPTPGVVLAAPTRPDEVAVARAAARADGVVDDAAVGARIADRLAELAATVAASTTVTGLVVTGGAVAGAVLAALGVVALDLVGEVEPGVPVGHVRLGDTRCTVVTKAGGFGDAAALVRAVAHVRVAAR